LFTGFTYVFHLPVSKSGGFLNPVKEETCYIYIIY
jgi:hypothetical protein